MRAQPETVHAKNAELQQFRAKLNQIELELKDIGDQLKEELRGMKQLCTNFEKMEQCQRKQQQTPQGETSDKIVTPFTSNKMKSDHPLMQQQTLKSPIWDIDLFEQRRFRNGNTEAQCMECGQKFAPQLFSWILGIMNFKKLLLVFLIMKISIIQKDLRRRMRPQ
ncbi:hypothetical protein GPALN_005077 [Globodera pallida]|nr:hypothetical protein GPALN_005077 [Globodera pallida]